MNDCEWTHPTGVLWEFVKDGITAAEVQQLAPGWYGYWIYELEKSGGATSLAEAKEIVEATTP